jgi:hypothetical protein
MARGREEPRLAARSVVLRQSDVYTAHTHTKKKDGRSDGSDDGASSASSGGARTPGAAEHAEVRAVEQKLSTADEFDVESPTATAE